MCWTIRDLTSSSSWTHVVCQPAWRLSHICLQIDIGSSTCIDLDNEVWHCCWIYFFSNLFISGSRVIVIFERLYFWFPIVSMRTLRKQFCKINKNILLYQSNFVTQTKCFVVTTKYFFREAKKVLLDKFFSQCSEVRYIWIDKFEAVKIYWLSVKFHWLFQWKLTDLTVRNFFFTHESVKINWFNSKKNIFSLIN